MRIRLMERADARTAAGIETASFSIPWTESMLAAALEGRLDTFWVLEDGDGMAGYCCMRSIAGEGEILRIAVLPEKRGLGYGKKLMDAMVGFASSSGVEAMTLEVRESNLPAINLYKSYGFEREAVRKDYYQNPKEDALLMWKRNI